MTLDFKFIKMFIDKICHVHTLVYHKRKWCLRTVCLHYIVLLKTFALHRTVFSFTLNNFSNFSKLSIVFQNVKFYVEWFVLFSVGEIGFNFLMLNRLIFDNEVIFFFKISLKYSMCLKKYWNEKPSSINLILRNTFS